MFDLVMIIHNDDLIQTAVEIFDNHPVKEKGAGEKGLLLPVDPLWRPLRLEVGYDMEPQIALMQTDVSVRRSP